MIEWRNLRITNMVKHIPVSIGELIDKITILEIKQRNIANPEQLENVERELSMLLPLDTENIIGTDLWLELSTVNEKLWEVEDELRKLEQQNDFGGQFVTNARSVYKLNDQRAAIKRQINLKYGSSLIEEKQYVQYA